MALFRHSKRSAFTLVELLVVIGIIALLISILLPTLASARRQANMVKCASNLRQIGLGLQMYGQLYTDHLPASHMPSEIYTLVDSGLPGGNFTINPGSDVYWWQRLQIEKLLPGAGNPSKSPFVCPADTNPFEPFNQDGSGPSLASMCQCSYGMNNFLTIDVGPQQETVLPLKDQDNPVTAPLTSSTRRVEWPKAFETPHPSNKVVVTDLYYGYIIDWYYPNTIPNADATQYPWNLQIDWRRHASSKSKVGTINVLYLDGHVATARQNTNGKAGHDQPNVVNDINGLDYSLGTTVVSAMKNQSQPYDQ